MRELGQTDIKLLRALLSYGRTSFNEIAKQCRVSPDLIWKHYKDLKREGVIVGATILFNYQKIGLNIAMIMMSVEPKNLPDVFSRLEKIPHLKESAFFRYYNSPYNVAAIARLKNLRDLETVKQLINKNIEINEIETHLWTGVRNSPQNILFDPTQADSESDDAAPVEQASLDLDEVDQKIIDALHLNGRIAFKKLGAQIGVSTATVARRYERLKASNYLKPVVQVNPLKLGFQNILEVKVASSNQAETDRMAVLISKIPGVSYVLKISGNFDLSIVALVSDCNSIVRINDEILKVPNIKKMMATLRRLPAEWPGRSQHISTF